MCRTVIQNTTSKIHSIYFQLKVIQRLYINAVIALIVYFISSVALGYQYAKSLLIIFLLFWGAAICYDLVALYKKVYGCILGKGFLIILFSLCTNFAIVLSNQIVNDITSVDPSKFPHTTAFLSILSIPFLIAAGFSILYFVLIVLLPFLFIFHTVSDDKATEVIIPGYSANSSIPFKKTTRTIQFISLAFFCGLVFNFSQKSIRSYETFLTNTARSFLYQMEMYPKASCVKEEGSRVAFLNNGKILIAVKNSTGIVFSVQKCKSEP